MSEPEVEVEVEDFEDQRPRTRADCLEGGVNSQRPCPWVSCRYHLALDISPGGLVQMSFPDKEVWELTETCALDVAGDGEGQTLEVVGQYLAVTRERIRQIESKALRRAKGRAALLEDMEPAGAPLAAVVDPEAWMRRQLETWTVAEAEVATGRPYPVLRDLARRLVAAGLLQEVEAGSAGELQFQRPRLPKATSSAEAPTEVLEALHQLSGRTSRSARVEREIPAVPSRDELAAAAASAPSRAAAPERITWQPVLVPGHQAPPAPPPPELHMTVTAVERRAESLRKWLQSQPNQFTTAEAAEGIGETSTEMVRQALASLLQAGEVTASGERAARKWQRAGAVAGPRVPTAAPVGGGQQAAVERLLAVLPGLQPVDLEALVQGISAEVESRVEGARRQVLALERLRSLLPAPTAPTAEAPPAEGASE